MNAVTFETTELWLASFLQSATDIEPVLMWRGNTCVFHFPKETVVDTCVKFAMSGDARVEPRKMFFVSAELRKKMNAHKAINRNRVK